MNERLGTSLLFIFLAATLKNNGRAVAALLFATLLWGSSFSFTKVQVAVMPPMYLLGYRFLLAAVVLILIFRSTITAEFSRVVRSKLLLTFSLISFVAIAFQTYGVKFTTASNAGLITAFSVVLVPIIKRVHFGKEIPRRSYAAAGMAFCGIYAISFGLAIPETLNRGDLFVFFCAPLYGYHILLLEKTVREFSGATIMFVSFAFTSVACMALGICAETHPFPESLFAMPVALSFLGLVMLATVMPCLLAAWGQKSVPAEAAALIYVLEPVFAIMIAWIFLNEMFTAWQMVGAGIVVTALLIGVRAEQGPEKTQSEAASCDRLEEG